MKYEMSFYNKGVLKNDLKRFSWMGVLYSLFLIFIFPCQILIAHSNNTKGYKVSMQLIFGVNDVQAYSIFIIPVIVAIFLFRYIQNKNSVDMLHSLPIKRVTLYDSHVFFGIMTLVIPVIITAIISCILKSTLNLNDLNLHFTYNQIFAWCGTTIAFSVFIFLFSVLIGMVTGLSTAQGILTYIFLLLPAGLGFLIVENLNMFFFGFNFSSSIFENFSPFIRINRLYYNPLTNTEIVTYIILSILIYALARLVYAKRDLEAATNAVAFKTLQPIFKYGVTFCCTLLGGVFFTDGQYSLPWSMLGYFIGGLIGYYIAEMIIKKSIKIFKNVKGYLIYAGIFSVILLCVNFDIMGYEKRIPDLTEIESISFADNSYSFNYIPNSKSYLYYEKVNFKNIKNLHNQILINEKYIKNSMGRFNIFTIKYNLKNGKEIERQYCLPNELVKDYLKPIYESKEYKKINFDILKVDAINVDKITISPFSTSKNLNLINPSEIKEVMDILKTVTLNKSYEEMQDIRQPWGNIDLLLSNDKRINLSFYKTNKKLEKWLADKSYLKNARIMPEDIKHIIVAKRINGRIEDVSNADVKKLKISDKIRIENCMQNSCEENTDESIYNLQYDLDIVLINASLGTIRATFDEKHAPEFVKEYFK